jgi:hypothetical protein
VRRGTVRRSRSTLRRSRSTVRRLQRVQRLRCRWLQGLPRLRRLLRMQLRLLCFVGSLPLHLLGAHPFPIASKDAAGLSEKSFDA